MRDRLMVGMCDRDFKTLNEMLNEQNLEGCFPFWIVGITSKLSHSPVIRSGRLEYIVIPQHCMSRCRFH